MPDRKSYLTKWCPSCHAYRPTYFADACEVQGFPDAEFCSFCSVLLKKGHDG